MEYLIISPEWLLELENEGITTLDVALDYDGTKLMSLKHRSKTWLHTTKQGHRIFIKQDTASKARVILRTLFKCQKPISPVEKEYGKLQKMQERGFSVPEVILRGAKRKCGILPDKAVMIMLPVPGTSVDKIWGSDATDAVKQKAKEAALATLTQLWEKGCDWGIDCKPEHFFVDEQGNVSIIDVERMRFYNTPLPQKKRDAQLARFNDCLQSTRQHHNKN